MDQYYVQKQNILEILKQFISVSFSYNTSPYINDQDILNIWIKHNSIQIDNQYIISENIIKEFLNHIVDHISYNIMIMLDKKGLAKLAWDADSNQPMLLKV